MLSVRVMAVGAFVIIPVFGQVEADVIAPHQHGPVRDFKDRGDGTATSSNWSGFAVTGSSFTSAEGSWTVPTATCITGSQYSSFWVGLDGYSSRTVEQTGTDSDCATGRPRYYAWYEFYPHASILISGMTIKPGDQMSASVTYGGNHIYAEN